jgi:hypothetical protein
MRCGEQIGDVETREEDSQTTQHRVLTDCQDRQKTPSDHLHLTEYYRKVLEPRLSCKILFSNDVPKTIDGWMEKATGEWAACFSIKT